MSLLLQTLSPVLGKIPKFINLKSWKMVHNMQVPNLIHPDANPEIKTWWPLPPMTTRLPLHQSDITLRILPTYPARMAPARGSQAKSGQSPMARELVVDHYAWCISLDSCQRTSMLFRNCQSCFSPMLLFLQFWYVCLALISHLKVHVIALVVSSMKAYY